LGIHTKEKIGEKLYLRWLDSAEERSPEPFDGVIGWRSQWTNGASAFWMTDFPLLPLVEEPVSRTGVGGVKEWNNPWQSRTNDKTTERT
jgi:hypothetical protein